MNTKNLDAFLAIVKYGTFKAASEVLHTTQPAISTRIAKLEEDVGSELFDRSDKRVRLTSKGYALLPYAERIAALLKEMQYVAGERNSCRQTMRLGATETVVHLWVAKFLNALHGHYPGLSIELIVDQSTILRDKLVTGELDLAFLTDALEDADIEFQPFCSYPLAWVASPRLTDPGTELDLHDLARFPLITYPRQSKPYTQLQELFNAVNMPTVRINGLSSLATMIHMAVDGIGIGILPLAAVEKELSSGELIRLNPSKNLPDLEYAVANRTDPFFRTVATLACTLR
ncbi:LysR family transcriptional regulator [Hahella ganghwensis]|uniref:LysR family transcriptional regulator n=1 Tax=Hahella ganghwensis TaxID=286420 RepID=UPI00037DEB68|nr:LysR family transcriptional regulator [Hahella ganghwensis]